MADPSTVFSQPDPRIPAYHEPGESTVLNKLKEAANRVVYGKAPVGGPTMLSGVTFTRLDGTPLPATEIAGKVVLFVNVASRCGLTPQYGQLVELYHRYRDRGLVIVGAPCNQFLSQEPGGSTEIASFCAMNYGVDFPLLQKLDVNGAERNPLYQFLIGSAAGQGNDITWNFEKFLVGREGTVRARFSPKTLPNAAEIIEAIEAAL